MTVRVLFWAMFVAFTTAAFLTDVDTPGWYRASKWIRAACLLGLAVFAELILA